MTTSDPPPVAWSFRRQTIASSQGLLRILHTAASSYGGDIEAFVIFLAIACASVDAAMRNTELAADPPEAGPLPDQYFRRVSRRAVAASTGLPRETVRRKIAVFIEKGDLLADGSGVRIRAGLLDDPRNVEFAETMIREFGRTSAQLARMQA